MDYFEAAKFLELILDKALFWSRTQQLQKAVAAKVDIKCADNIFPMKVIDHMDSVGSISYWCSDKTGTVKVNEKCSSKQASRVFWAEASKRMAEAVIGKSCYLTTNAYYGPMSYFKLYELSTLLLRQSPSTDLAVLNVHSKGSNKLCGTGKLVTLEQEVARTTVKYRCFDVYGNPENPLETDHIVKCVKHIIEAIQSGKYFF